MEQQDVISPCTPPANSDSRDTDSRRHSPRLSSPPPSYPENHELASSEPTLRFPRPQGNRHLANWISSSNPDIMRVATTATNDAGLSESTYELISGTDSESQDGNYTESMGESIGSLDYNRPDDVHSLAGTEHTQDDESVLDETEPQPQHTAGAPAVIIDMDDDDVEDEAQSEQADDADSESDDGAASRSSLEYTQQSLKTPSITPPEPSKVEYWLGDDEDQPTFKEMLISYTSTALTLIQGVLRKALPVATLVTVCVLLAEVTQLLSGKNEVGQVMAPVPTLDITTTSQLLSTSTASTASYSSGASSNGVGLIPMDDTIPDDWLFGSKKLDVGFSPQSPGEVLFHVPPTIKQTWLQKECLEVVATRSEGHVDTSTTPVDEGVLIKFPKRETHGVVSLTVKSTCRPKVHKVVEVHFAKGIVEEVLGLTKHLAHDISDLVPAAAQEAERRLGSARRSLETVSETLSHNVHSLSDRLMNAAKVRLAGASKSYKDTKQEVRETLRKGADWIHDLPALNELRVPEVAAVENQLRIGLLNAQISARLWWLKMTDRREYYDYETKARDFMEKMVAEAKAKQFPADSAPASTSRSWVKFVNRRRCQPTSSRGRRGVQQCIPEV